MMSTFMVLAFLFFCGSLIGWTLELFYRRFISAANPERKWINPGFLIGPYLPLYGFSLAGMFLLSYLPVDFIEEKWLRQLILFILMAIFITIIEYIAGLIFIRKMNIKLWDYTNEWGNIKGIICPKYSFFWLCLSAFYYFIIHPRALGALYWLADHLSFCFGIGFFYGVFTIDVVFSMQLMSKIRVFAVDHDIEVKIEEFKAQIDKRNELKHKKHFVLAFKSDGSSLTESLKAYAKRESEKLEKSLNETKEKLDEFKDETKEKLDEFKDETKENLEEIEVKVRDSFTEIGEKFHK